MLVREIAGPSRRDRRAEEAVAHGTDTPDEGAAVAPELVAARLERELQLRIRARSPRPNVRIEAAARLDDDHAQRAAGDRVINA